MREICRCLLTGLWMKVIKDRLIRIKLRRSRTNMQLDAAKVSNGR